MANEATNPLLPRIAFEMATGSGKTAVIAMLVAWQALNRRANPWDGRFADAFLVVAPGITTGDRLRVLLPSDPENCYRARDLVPIELLENLQGARVTVTNFHPSRPRERYEASRLTKQAVAGSSPVPRSSRPRRERDRELATISESGLLPCHLCPPRVRRRRGRGPGPAGESPRRR